MPKTIRDGTFHACPECMSAGRDIVIVTGDRCEVCGADPRGGTPITATLEFATGPMQVGKVTIGPVLDDPTKWKGE